MDIYSPFNKKNKIINKQKFSTYNGWETPTMVTKYQSVVGARLKKDLATDTLAPSIFT